MSTKLSNLEKEVIDLFVRMAAALNLPRSIGELYGMLYISPEPLCMDDLIERLRISKGAASQGLKILRSFGAVKTVYVSGTRRDYYTAETRLRKIASGFVNEKILPRLENGKERLAQIEELAKDSAPGQKEFIEERIEQLRGWHRRASGLLPFVLNLIKQE